MKVRYLFLVGLFLFVHFSAGAQNFSVDSFFDFRKSVSGIRESQLEMLYPRQAEYYYKGFEEKTDLKNVLYLDKVIQKLELTGDELELMGQNLFFVSQRLSCDNFGFAFHNVYSNDLPVFISTDAILHTLHMSYDQILKNMEREIMSSNLELFLKSLYDNFGNLQKKYGEVKLLEQGLKDADIFITMAYSMITDQLAEGHIASSELLREVWEAIQGEEMTNMSLFTFPERKRNIDFSQFAVRGHYVYTEQEKWLGLKSLEPYFRTMMWLGRIDFLLTPPPDNPWEIPWTDAEIQRMQTGAYLVNELVQHSDKLPLLQFNEKVINYLVGESDNITPEEFSEVLTAEGISSATQLVDSTVSVQLQKALSQNPELGQKILSDFFLMDPQGSEPGILPVSYRISGQRFIIDSYVLGSVVYDKLIFNGQKVMRMMPLPLDILFTLGNNDVIPLLQGEFEKYPYAEQLAVLRYLIDRKSPEFWNGSLYNIWLNSIRELNPGSEKDGLPIFMQTAAWHQEKMNTQLAGWSQLRHDNLLYAKQSYTGGTGCSFPVSYVEPYPGFFGKLKSFAEEAGIFFSTLQGSNVETNRIAVFFPKYATVMEKLETLAQKELNGSEFTNEEQNWLRSMLFSEGGSGTPPFSGWYTDLFYDKWDAAEGDFTVVDVHTQPTDEWGNVVGKVLHTGVGKVNLGVFAVNCPDSNNELVAFVGPVMSYYEKITDNFKRITDQEWEEMVFQNELPERPEWTNIYLAGKKGEILVKGLELPAKLYTGTVNVTLDEPQISAFPNPVTNQLYLSVGGTENVCKVAVFNASGVLMHQTEDKFLPAGHSALEIPFNGMPPGLYIVRISFDKGASAALKIVKK